jgi:hypothetical protein
MKMAQCRSKRPGTTCTGMGEQALKYFSDHGKPQSDLGSDCEVERDELGDGNSDPGFD